MALISKKITSYSTNIKDLADTPELTAEQLKAFFDGRGDNEIKASINGIVDELVSKEGANQIGANEVGDGLAITVQGVLGELHSNKVDKSAIEQSVSNSPDKIPSSKAVTDKMVEIGAGDMQKAIYDANNKVADAFNSANHSYDNLTSELDADNVQDAIDEVVEKLTADKISYDHSQSMLLAENVQDAIDELAIKTTETCVVTVSADTGISIIGREVTMTDLTDDAYSQTVVLDDISTTFNILAGHSYEISVDDLSAEYGTPLAKGFLASNGNVRIVSMQYIKIIRYGFKIERSEQNADNRVSYTHDAVLMTPASVNLSTGVFNAGSWGDFINEVHRPVMLKSDGTVDYELDVDDNTKKSDGTASDVDNTAYDGNAMTEFRKYKWVKRYYESGFDYVTFSNYKWDDDYKAYAFENENGTINDTFYYGMYKGTYVGTKLRSIGTGAVMVSQTRQTEIDRAVANGSGYYTIYNSAWQYIGDLLTLISKSCDSQAKFGSGRSKSNNSSAIAVGSTKSYPAFWGKSDETSDVKVFSIEGFWGNIFEGMAGMVLINGDIKVKMTPPYNINGTGYTSTGVTPSGTSAGFVSSVKEYSDLGYVPSVASGSGTTFYCDGLWYVIDATNIYYALACGDWGSALRCGSRSMYLYAVASRTNTYFGSRLSYLPPA